MSTGGRTPLKPEYRDYMIISGEVRRIRLEINDLLDRVGQLEALADEHLEVKQEVKKEVKQEDA